MPRLPISERTQELLRSIHATQPPAGTRSINRFNEEVLEHFLAALSQHPNHDRLTVTRQRLPIWHRRTTHFNYIVEIAGHQADVLTLVAHYDAWGGPGADDNSTGEEILKQYILSDLDAAEPPAFCHRYLFAGSEECGLIGFISQLFVAAMLWAATFAFQSGRSDMGLLALVLTPFTLYRFGVAGSRYYVRSLSEQELRRLRGVISVDSVGEGKLYIPETTMGADFVRALLPYQGADPLDDCLKEIAHAHGISYNTCVAGGTTDHLAFLEVNRSLARVVYESFRKLWCRWRNRPYQAPLTLHASALVALCPGKASPFVIGGKLHTPRDTPDRLQEKPLHQTLQILDDFFDAMEKGKRHAQPRRLEDCHYARLFRLSDGRQLLALKDAEESNCRNVNLLAEGEWRESVLHVIKVIEWGNEVRLTGEVKEYTDSLGLEYEEITPDRLQIQMDKNALLFSRRSGVTSRRIGQEVMSAAGRVFARFNFLAMFGTAYAVGMFFDSVLFGPWIESGFVPTVLLAHPIFLAVSSILLQLAILARLFSVDFPTWIDNIYKHQNEADNLGSLHRERKEKHHDNEHD